MSVEQTAPGKLSVPAVGKLEIVPGEMVAIVGQPFSYQIKTKGGVPPIKFALDAGQSLPTGWALSEGGLLTGPAPTAATPLDADGNPTPIFPPVTFTVTSTW